MTINFHEKDRIYIDPNGGKWLVVGTDPHVLMFGDEADEALAETNWDALMDDLPVEPVEVRHELTRRAGYTWIYTFDGEKLSEEAEMELLAEVEALMIRNASLYPELTWHDGDPALRHVGTHQSLLVRLGTETEEVVREIQKALSDRPLLDEEAYSARELEAWDRYLFDGLRFDTARDLTERGFSDEFVDSLCDDDDALAAACGDMHYYSGFTGEHHPPLWQLLFRRALA